MSFYVLKEQDDRPEVEAEDDDDRNRKREVSDNPGRSALLAALNEDSPWVVGTPVQREKRLLHKTVIDTNDSKLYVHLVHINSQIPTRF